MRKASEAYQAKDYAASADAFAAAIAAGGDDATLYYNAACSSALAGRKDAAFAQLRQAIGAGYTRVDAIRADADLASLHGDPRFDALLADAARRELATTRMWSNSAWKTPYRPVLDADQRELVLDRAMALDQDELDLDDLKWVVLMVLFNQPGSEAAYAWMETQMFADEPEPVH